MHDERLGQSTKSRTKNSSLFLVVQTCKLKDVDAFIEQFSNLFYTTLRECVRILGENVVILGENVIILVIFCLKQH